MTGSPELALFWSGALATAISAFFLWRLGADSGNHLAGAGAALLMLALPTAWFSAVTNPVRLFLAVASTAGAWLCWRAARAPSRRWWFSASFGIALLAGFQPTAGPLLIPLYLWAGIRRRSTVRDWLYGFVCMASIVAAWSLVMLIAVGGWRLFWLLFAIYSRDQFASTSLFFGAPGKFAWQMVKEGAAWNALAVIPWIWAIRRFRADLFLILWFLPAFFFSILFHVADPDHTLFTAPALCFLGARLAASTARWPGLACAAAISAALFFLPLPKPLDRTTRAAVREGHLRNRQLLD